MAIWLRLCLTWYIHLSVQTYFDTRTSTIDFPVLFDKGITIAMKIMGSGRQ